MSNQGKTVKAHYRGTLDDGTQFDSSSVSYTHLDVYKRQLLARDLIGAPACEALIRLIRESDAELAQTAGEARDAAAGSDGAGGPVAASEAGEE